MWKTMTWAEARAKGLKGECGEHVGYLTRNFPNGPNKQHNRGNQTECDLAELHIDCTAWVEEVTLPRVVVEWTEKTIAYRLVQTTGGNLVVECQAYKEDLMGFKQSYWEFWTSPSSGMGSGLVAALVEKLDGVGQK